MLSSIKTSPPTKMNPFTLRFSANCKAVYYGKEHPFLIHYVYKPNVVVQKISLCRPQFSDLERCLGVPH